MDAHQESRRNPFGMDEDCTNCEALCEPRTQVVHGYGSVDADFLFVGERPGPDADAAGIPYAGESGEPLRRFLAEIGLLGRRGDDADDRDEADGAGVPEEDNAESPEDDSAAGSASVVPRFDPDEPTVSNCYLTHLTRCRHPERPPTDEEVATCEPFLNAEVRMINPEILVPLGQRALEEVLAEYTTRSGEDLAVEAGHGEELRGRGFEIIPLVEPSAWTDAQREVALAAFEATLGRDYRQTKGRRSR